MMNQKFFKRGIAAVCAAVTAASGTAVTAFADDAAAVAAPPVTVVAIGDDCLAETNGTSPANYVAAYLGGTAINDAKIGTTSGQLVNDLSQAQNLQNDVASADVVLVSVGVNDLIEEVLYENTDLVDLSTCKTLKDVANGLSTDATKLAAANKKLASELPALVETIAANLEVAVSSIQSLNSSADIVVQTVNNPLGVDYNDKKGILEGVSDNRRAVIAYLYNYLDVALAGGEITNILLEPMTIAPENSLNQQIQNIPGVSVADFYVPYVGARGEKAIGFTLSNIFDLNMTFTPVGQVLLAAAAIQSTDKLACGNGGVIATAYASTGKVASLKSLRASADAIITEATKKTAVTYTMGDADANGSITATDVSLLLTCAAQLGAGMGSSLNPLQRKAMDADGSGVLNARDAAVWLSYAAQSGAGLDVDLAEFLKQYQNA